MYTNVKDSKNTSQPCVQTHERISMNNKLPGQMKCALQSCGQPALDQDSGRVEVCTVLPETGLSTKLRLKVSWSKSGEAAFHQDCWDNLLKASRVRNSKNDPFKLTQPEREMIRVAGKTAERHDSSERIREEAERVASMIRGAQHCVVFTGAGISTSAGIGDYRGKKGKWTEEDRAGVVVNSQEPSTSDGEPVTKKPRHGDQTEELTDSSSPQQEADEDEAEGVAYERLRPTYTHEAVRRLVESGLVKHVISQNGDGLHGLSGICSPKLSELHGNVFVEKCEKCGKRYMRDFYVLDDLASQYYEELEDYGKTDVKRPKHAKKCDLCGLSHNTGRKCTEKVKGKNCGGALMDTIINFRDHLEEEILDSATDHASRCDLLVSLGTTMTVTPASDLVYMGREPLRVVVCNRQKTDVDSVCITKDPADPSVTLGARIYGDCDRFMRKVMSHLLEGAELEEWESGRSQRMKEYDRQRADN